MNERNPGLAHQQTQIVKLLAAMAPREGYNLTALPDVRFLRSNRPLQQTPVLYDPGIVIVCQGCKRGYWGGKTYLYDAQHYLAVSLPVPFTMETQASVEEPLLAIYLHLDLARAADLLWELNEQGVTYSSPARSLVASPIEPALADTVARFLHVMASPIDAAILGRAMVREIYFRVFQGAQGGALSAALGVDTPLGRIGRAIRRVHEDYAGPIDVLTLAREARMSVPTFHAHFKAATETSPMQYLKSVRLHQARLFMLRQSQTAASAANAVGYESASQFSREFKRFFGRTPRAEVRWMRDTFDLPPPVPGSIYVASH